MVSGDRPEPAEATVEQLSEAVIRLTRTSHWMRVQLASREVDGLDWAGFALLFALVQGGPQRPSALADAACVDPSTVSKQVAELVALRLVERRPDPVDGRATLLQATREGAGLYERRRARRLDLFALVVADWPEADVVALTELVSRFTDGLLDVRPQVVAAHAAAKDAG